MRLGGKRNLSGDNVWVLKIGGLIVFLYVSLSRIASNAGCNFEIASPKTTPNSHNLQLLSKMTRSHITDIKCPEPLMPLYDRIVYPVQSGDDNQTIITKYIHMAWVKGSRTPQSRCLAPDMVNIAEKWMAAFPQYSYYFHDDEAVDALFAQEWPEFPLLGKLMEHCVHFGHAMRIDIWRALILYRYGGLYSDFDLFPGPLLNESVISPGYSALFLSDSWNRPSQWFQAIGPKSPIAYEWVVEICKRLLDQDDVSKGKLVFLTGPDALKFGYTHGLGHVEDYATIFNIGDHKCKFCKGPVKKLPVSNYVDNTGGVQAPYPRNSTNSADMTTVKERIKIELKTKHWTEQINEIRGTKPHESCKNLLVRGSDNFKR